MSIGFKRCSSLLALMLVLVGGCASTSAPRPQAELVDHVDYGQGLYQLKIASRDQGQASVLWQGAAGRLCPAGFTEFDVSNAVTLDSSRADPNTQKAKSFLSGGLIGLAVDNSEQTGSALKTGYVLCHNSELDMAAAKRLAYGRY